MQTLTGSQLRELVENELSWDPEVTPDTISVLADDGVVTLSGFVGTYAERLAAGRAALRIVGVRSLANDLVVRLPDERLDSEIAHDVATALRFNLNVPSRVKANVHDGFVTLQGEVTWQFQKYAAEQAVQHIKGVRDVVNTITLTAPTSVPIVKAKIEAALERSAQVEARRVKVQALDSKIVLSGTVRSYAEKEEAARAAWASPGVTAVDNQLSIVA